MNSVRSPLMVRVDVVHVQEGDVVGELRMVGVAGKHRAAGRIDLGDHVHGRFGSQVPQHPFHVAGSGKPPRAPRRIAHLQDGELDRGVEGNVHRQLGDDAVLDVLEDAVAESVAAGVGPFAAPGQRRRRPEPSRRFVAQEECLAARIRDGVVVPRRETELVRVLVPRIDRPILGDQATEVGVGHHVHPRRRRDLAFGRDDDVLAAVRAEAAQSVVHDKVRPCRSDPRMRMRRRAPRSRQDAVSRARPEHAAGPGRPACLGCR